jgi:hypothetical protein
MNTETITNQIIDIALEKTKDERLLNGVQTNVVDPMVSYTKMQLKPFFLGFVALNFVFLILLVIIVWSLIRNGRDLHSFSDLQKMVT